MTALLVGAIAGTVLALIGAAVEGNPFEPEEYR